MDWYNGCGINDFLVPEDQDLLDRHPSPDTWSNWDINATEVEFNFIDESFTNEIELESCLHDKDQSSSSSVGGGWPEQSFQQTALSCYRPNYQLQDISRFEQMDDIFLDSVLEDLPCVENLYESFYPENRCNDTPDGLQKDIAAPKFIPCNSKYKDCLDIEAPTVKVLDPFDQCSTDEDMHEHSLIEESILLDLEMVIAQFPEKTRICFRDALYRLATYTKQEHEVADQDAGPNIEKAMPLAARNETVRSEEKKPMESETNGVDRAVANLMFNKMEINVQDLPLATLVNSNLEVIGSNGLQRKSSKALNLAQKFHHTQGDAEVPGFGQQTATGSNIAYADPIKKSFMLEFD